MVVDPRLIWFIRIQYAYKTNSALGLRKAREIDRALLAKLVWNMLTGFNSLWAKMFSSKYLKGKSLLDCETKWRDSGTWRAIMYRANLVKSNVKGNLGDGNHIYFRKDN